MCWGQGWWVGLVVARPEVTANEEGGKRGYRRSSDGQETPDLKGESLLCPDAGLSLAAPPATLFSQEVPPSLATSCSPGVGAIPSWPPG